MELICTECASSIASHVFNLHPVCYACYRDEKFYNYTKTKTDMNVTFNPEALINGPHRMGVIKSADNKVYLGFQLADKELSVVHVATSEDPEGILSSMELYQNIADVWNERYFPVKSKPNKLDILAAILHDDASNPSCGTINDAGLHINETVTEARMSKNGDLITIACNPGTLRQVTGLFGNNPTHAAILVVVNADVYAAKQKELNR